jgi:hypothetical protein
MVKQTIIVPANGFIGWGGGIDYIKYQLKFLAKISYDDPSIKIILLVPFESIKDKIIRFMKNCVKFIIGRPINRGNPINAYKIFCSDVEINANVDVQKYMPHKNNGKFSIQLMVKKSINPLVFPTVEPLPNLKCKQIGYIYDLQHISFPHFFTDEEKNSRNFNFKNIL